jgi:phage-related protein
MPTITSGAHELRIRDSTVAIRVFYFVAVADTIVVFHGFQKQTQQTPRHEIDLGRERLKEVLHGSI